MVDLNKRRPDSGFREPQSHLMDMPHKLLRLFFFVVLAMSLAGCGWGSKSYPDVLSIRVFSYMPSPIVNLTSEDLPAYPPLKELLDRWEASGGNLSGFSTPYPYEEGVALVKSLQSRVPEAKWSSKEYVPIGYKGEAFLVGASKVHADG